MKTSENLWFSDIIRGYQKRSVAWNFVTKTSKKSEFGFSFLVRDTNGRNIIFSERGLENHRKFLQQTTNF